MTKTKAYLVDEIVYCEGCFSWLWPYRFSDDQKFLLIGPGDYPDDPVACAHCGDEDVFGRPCHVVLDFSDETWLIPWPEEEGHYWFHGWLFGDDGETEPETYLIKVCLDSTKKPIYVIGEDFLYPPEACGVWHPQQVVLPTPPQKPKGAV